MERWEGFLLFKKLIHRVIKSIIWALKSTNIISNRRIKINEMGSAMVQ